jgi:hypothetical protein
MQPGYMPVNQLRSAAGSIVFLGQVLCQHTLAEARFMPGDIITFFPRERQGTAIFNDLKQAAHR